jgi:hypothetical protein
MFAEATLPSYPARPDVRRQRNTCGMRLRTGDPTLVDDLRAHFERSGSSLRARAAPTSTSGGQTLRAPSRRLWR